MFGRLRAAYDAHLAGLLERDLDLATVDAALRDARGGEGRLLLIEGRAGVGKSSLLAEARSLAAEHGMRVVGARGSALEQEFAFGVVRQLFEPLLVPAGERERLLAGAAAAAGRIFESVDENGGDASFATLHSLYWLSANAAAATPLLVAVDDLQWCDRSSLRFVVYLIHRLEGLPLLLAATLRSGEPGVDPGLLADVMNDPAAIALHPAELSAEATGRLIRDQLEDEPDERFRDACHHATGGNPLLMRQLLSSLRIDGVRPDRASAERVREIGPRAVSRTLLLRLARLPGEWVAVARAIAVLGDGADPATIAALAEVDEHTLIDATRELVRLDVLHPEPLGFVHPLVRDAVHHDLSAAERELLHATAARLLLDAGAPAQEVGAQLLLVPGGALPDAAVVEVLQEAARTAQLRGAPEGAVAFLRRALDERPGPDVRRTILFELGLAEALAVDEAAVDHLRAAYDELDDPEQRAVAAQALAQALLLSAPVEEATAFLRRAIEETPDALADERLMLEAMEIISIYFGAEDWEQIRAARRRTELPGDGVGAKVVAALSAFDWAMSDGTADACAQLALDAFADGELFATDNGFIVVPAMIVVTIADRDESLEVWEHVIAQARKRGAPLAIAWAHMWSGVTRLWRGDLVEAEALLRAGVEDFALWGHLRGRDVFAASFLARTLVERGDPAAARDVLEAVERPHGRRDLTRVWLAATAELLLAEGRAQEALAVIDELDRDFKFMANPAWAAWRPAKARALDVLDRRDEAAALLAEELELARHWGAPSAIGRMLRLLGTVERDDGLEHLHDAVTVLAGSTARLEKAKALAALGQALRRARRPTEAREPLRQALELAERCGAQALAQTARSELYATGARPRRTALSGVDSLTTSERRVADLAAAGQTNRDIAQTLYVTPKTVEVHLGNAYRKLGIRSRRELARALGSKIGVDV